MSIELRNVCYTYTPGTPYESHALADLSITIEDGEFVGVMGRTGCGKSTLIQLIAGLMTPEKGQVLIDGKDINDRHYDRTELRRKVGVVFQFPEVQLFEKTVAKDVAFGLKHFGLTEEEKTAAVKDALEKLGFDFEKVRDKSPLEFSGGERRRIAIAGVLAAKPEILILDEPVAGLDPLGRTAFLKLLGELNERGVTVIMISHSADALAEHAGRIVVLKDGRLLMDGLAAEVFSNYVYLRNNGIGTGRVRHTVELLRQRGMDIPEDTVRYGQLLKEILGRKKA